MAPEQNRPQPENLNHLNNNGASAEFALPSEDERPAFNPSNGTESLLASLTPEEADEMRNNKQAFLRHLSNESLRNPDILKTLSPEMQKLFHAYEHAMMQADAATQRHDIFTSASSFVPTEGMRAIEERARQADLQPASAATQLELEAIRPNAAIETNTDMAAQPAHWWQRAKQRLSRWKEEANPEATLPNANETRNKKRTRLGLVAGVLAVSQLFAASSANVDKTDEHQIGSGQGASSAGFEAGSFIPEAPEIGLGHGPDGRLVPETAPSFTAAPEALPGDSNLWNVSHEILAENGYAATPAETDAVKDWYLRQTGETEASAYRMQAGTKLPTISAEKLAELVGKAKR